MAWTPLTTPGSSAEIDQFGAQNFVIALRWIAGELKKKQGLSTIKPDETAEEMAKRLRGDKILRRHISLQLADGTELTRAAAPEDLLKASARLAGARNDIPLTVFHTLLRDEAIRLGIATVLWNRRQLRASSGKTFAGQIDVRSIATADPPMDVWRLKYLVRSFAQVNQCGSGEASLFELDYWLSEVLTGMHGMALTICSSLLAAIAQGKTRHRLNVREFVRAIELLCTSTDEDLLRFTFMEMSTVGDYARGRTRPVVHEGTVQRKRSRAVEEAGRHLVDSGLPAAARKEVATRIRDQQLYPSMDGAGAGAAAPGGAGGRRGSATGPMQLEGPQPYLAVYEVQRRWEDLSAAEQDSAHPMAPMLQELRRAAQQQSNLPAGPARARAEARFYAAVGSGEVVGQRAGAGAKGMDGKRRRKGGPKEGGGAAGAGGSRKGSPSHVGAWWELIHWGMFREVFRRSEMIRFPLVWLRDTLRGATFGGSYWDKRREEMDAALAARIVEKGRGKGGLYSGESDAGKSGGIATSQRQVSPTEPGGFTITSIAAPPAGGKKTKSGKVHPWMTPWERFYRGASAWRHRWKEAVQAMRASVGGGGATASGGAGEGGASHEPKLPPVVPVEWLRARASPSELRRLAEAKRQHPSVHGRRGSAGGAGAAEMEAEDSGSDITEDGMESSSSDEDDDEHDDAGKGKGGVHLASGEGGGGADFGKGGADFGKGGGDAGKGGGAGGAAAYA